MRTRRIKFIFTILSLSTVFCLKAQISQYTLPKDSVKKVERVIAPYDSLSNITRHNVASLVGQRVQVMPLKDSSNDENARFYNEIFEVIKVDSIIKTDSFGSRQVKHYIRGKNEKYPNGVRIQTGKGFDETNGAGPNVYIPNSNVIVLGYFEKLVERLKGHKFYVKSGSDDTDLNALAFGRLFDPNTGKAIEDYSPDEEFTVNDVTYSDKLICLLSSAKHPQCYTTIHHLSSNSISKDEYDHLKALTKQWEDKMIRTYGKSNGTDIINGVVRLGFSKKMCEESWGKPYDINSSSGPRGTSEQWIYYNGSYLYFTNGKLTAIQN